MDDKLNEALETIKQLEKQYNELLQAMRLVVAQKEYYKQKYEGLNND